MIASYLKYNGTGTDTVTGWQTPIKPIPTQPSYNERMLLYNDFAEKDVDGAHITELYADLIQSALSYGNLDRTKLIHILEDFKHLVKLSLTIENATKETLKENSTIDCTKDNDYK